MKLQLLNIIFSLLLLPFNVLCSFWMFCEALNLAGLTFKEFTERNRAKTLTIGSGRFKLRKTQRFLTDFFRKHSFDPEKSIRFTRAFGFSTVLGLVALCLAFLSAVSVNALKYAFIGNIILVAANSALAIWGMIYRRWNGTGRKPLSAPYTETRTNRAVRIKNAVVYIAVGALLFGFLLFFMSAVASLVSSNQSANSTDTSNSNQTAIEIRARLTEILDEKGYETANVPTTYWEIDKSKLENVAAGTKGKSKFEFYGYTNGKTVDLVYNQIVYLSFPELESTERESRETDLGEGGKIFTCESNGMYFLVMYKNDTVIYAYSSDTLDDIKEILTEIGYLQ